MPVTTDVSNDLAGWVMNDPNYAGKLITEYKEALKSVYTTVQRLNELGIEAPWIKTERAFNPTKDVVSSGKHPAETYSVRIRLEVR